ncbi:MAG: hypothetical protein JWP29_1965 [Rhodoferax sp.]|nr:hypothetical protein [Rhodoferax sp.]
MLQSAFNWFFTNFAVGMAMFGILAAITGCLFGEMRWGRGLTVAGACVAIGQIPTIVAALMSAGGSAGMG